MLEKKGSRIWFAAITGWLVLNTLVWGSGYLMGSEVSILFALLFALGLPLGLFCLIVFVHFAQKWVDDGK